MTDYFALLDQPRRAWLDAAELKDVFHAKARELHPDAQTAADGSFTELNEAYQTLLDPKRRLQHLLTLLGHAPQRLEAAPAEIAKLFPAVADVMQEADAALQQHDSASNALTRSLAKPRLMQAAARVTAMLEQINQLIIATESELQQIRDDVPDSVALHQLYLRFAYLGRWRTELQERQTRLS